MKAPALSAIAALLVCGCVEPAPPPDPPANMPPMGATIPYTTKQTEPVPPTVNHFTEQDYRPSDWWRGGTLHTASPDAWNASAYKNKLATAADWLASMALNRGLDLHPDDLRTAASDVVQCVDEAVRPPTPPISDVRDVAAFCILTLRSTRQFSD